MERYLAGLLPAAQHFMNFTQIGKTSSSHPSMNSAVRNLRSFGSWHVSLDSGRGLELSAEHPDACEKTTELGKLVGFGIHDIVSAAVGPGEAKLRRSSGGRLCIE